MSFPTIVISKACGTFNCTLLFELPFENTVTLSAASTSGGSTTVNAFRIHMLREDGFPYTVLDSFASDTYQGAHYFIVGKNEDNKSQALELTAVTDGVGAYSTDTGINISTHSATSPLMSFTTGYKDNKLELRAENSLQNTNTTVNLYRINLNLSLIHI